MNVVLGMAMVWFGCYLMDGQLPIGIFLVMVGAYSVISYEEGEE